MARLTFTSEVVEQIGHAIAVGQISEGSILSTDGLADRFDVSRTVIREAMKVLESMGLIVARRRTGMQVLPMTEWRVLDPQIIRWRLLRPDRATVLQAMTQLREAVEPAAARLAAASDVSARVRPRELVEEMAAAIAADDRHRYATADERFHAAIIELSGNELFRALSASISGALRGQSDTDALPLYDAGHTLDMHRAIALAVADGDGPGAERAAHELFALMDQDIGRVSAAD